jgi:hypothetical protein
LEAIKLGVLGNVRPKRILGNLKHAKSRIKQPPEKEWSYAADTAINSRVMMAGPAIPVQKSKSTIQVGQNDNQSHELY